MRHSWMNGERWPTADWWYPSARQSKSSITMSYQQFMYRTLSGKRINNTV
ncbi:transposase [Aeromonas media WS]|nr:transposase [Aeromonas media WS]